MELQIIEKYDANLYDWTNLIKSVNDMGLHLFTQNQINDHILNRRQPRTTPKMGMFPGWTCMESKSYAQSGASITI